MTKVESAETGGGADVERLTFTPGPWKAHARLNFRGIPDLWEIHWSEDGECVAEIVHGTADARLIASAPELYEMLVDWSNSFWCPATDFNREAPRLLQMTGELLAKARGEA